MVSISSTSAGPYLTIRHCSESPYPSNSDIFASTELRLMLDANQEEMWDALWLLQEDIRNALESVRPGTFYPLPEKEFNV